MSEKLSGAEIFLRSLIDAKVDTLFGYPGGAIMPVYDALYDKRDKLNHILVRHEQGAIHAAQGYARVSGKVGVCIVTSGPGATNTVTGIADAMLDSTPVVVIAGQVGAKSLGTDAFQECDLVNVVRPISKWAYQIRSAKDVAHAVAYAFHIASTGRPGPVVLDFTRNAQVETTDYVPEKIGYMRGYDPVPSVSQDSIRQAAQLINESKRPLLLIGQGVELGGAQEEVRQLIERADIPAGCTLLGLSALPTDHPLKVGMLGMHGSLASNVKTQECDLLIGIGLRFADRITGKLSTYARQAKKIHFDIDPAEINKNVPVDVAVLGDCKDTVAEVLKLVKPNKHTEWIASFKPYQDKETKYVINPEVHPTEGPVRMGEVVNEVAEQSHGQAICVTDVGQNQMIAARYSKLEQHRSLVTSGGMGTMGFGLPAAIGATFGAPGRQVCLFSGDGGLQMTIEELGTIMEQKAPVKIVLLDNNFLGNVRQWQQLFYNRRYSFTHMLNPDYSLIAKAYQIPYTVVTKREDLKDAVKQMLEADGPFFLHAAVMEEDNVLPMTSPGSDVDDMMLELK